jgi:hypothetical protein
MVASTSGEFAMTFAGYFQSGNAETTVSTFDGVPMGKPEYIPQYSLTHIITNVPKGTTRRMIEEKMERTSPSSIKLEFSVESECPSDVQTQMKAPGNSVTEISWSRLCER